MYGTGLDTRDGGLRGSASRVRRWLRDIRQYFPSSMVQVMQKDAFDRLSLQQMLCEPETPAAVEPDVHLVTILLSLNRVKPNNTKRTAGMVVARVVEELERKLAVPMGQAVV